MKTLMTTLVCLMCMTFIFAQELKPAGELKKIEKKAVLTHDDYEGHQQAKQAQQQEEMDPQKMMEMWQEMLALGEEHKRLAEDVGTYKYESTFWMEPGAEPMKSGGKTVIEPMMDGRYFKETHSGMAMGQPFTGFGISAYDKVAGEYVSTWIDNMGTGIIIFKGNYNEDGQMVVMAEVLNPMTKALEAHKIVRTNGENGWGMDYYIGDFKNMHIEFTRIN